MTEAHNLYAQAEADERLSAPHPAALAQADVQMANLVPAQAVGYLADARSIFEMAVNANPRDTAYHQLRTSIVADQHQAAAAAAKAKDRRGRPRRRRPRRRSTSAYGQGPEVIGKLVDVGVSVRRPRELLAASGALVEPVLEQDERSLVRCAHCLVEACCHWETAAAWPRPSTAPHPDVLTADPARADLDLPPRARLIG